MANPKIWYYPDTATEAASLEAIDFGEALSDLQLTPVLPAEQSIGLDGKPWMVLTGAPRMDVRVVLERFGTESVARALESLEAHLAMGNGCAFSRDPDKAWAGYLRGNAVRGSAILRTTGNEWSYNASATLAADDWVCIESLDQTAQREYAQVSSVSGATITLKAGVKYSWDYETPVMVRHMDFFPVLHWLVENRTGPMVTSDRRMSWTLDVTLTTDPGGAQAFYTAEGSGNVLLGSESSLVGLTLEQVLRSNDFTGVEYNYGIWRT